MNQDEIKNNLLNADQWIRVLFMALYAVAAWAVLVVLIVIVLIQVIINLVAGEPNWNLQKTGYLLGCYLQQIVQYLLYNEDRKPFPFGTDFPSDEGFTIVRPAPRTPTAKPAPEPAADTPPPAPGPTAPAGGTVAPGSDAEFARPASPDLEGTPPDPAPESPHESAGPREESGQDDERQDQPPR